MAPWPVLRLTVVALLLLTVPAGLAQEGPSLPRGAIRLDEPIEVAAGETLVIGPGTSLTGSANVTVWGTLLVNGTPGDPAEFNVPVRVLEGGRAELRQARIWGVNSTALEVFGGTVELADVLFEGNTRGAIVKGQSRLTVRDVVFRDHTGEALYVEESARAHLSRTTFSGNGRGVTVYSARAFHVNDSDFVANGQHLVVDFGPWSVPGEDILLARNAFRAPAPTPAQLPSIVLRHAQTLVDEGDTRLVRMDSNRIEGAPTGVSIEGRALAVESVNDTFVDNGVGLSVSQSVVRLTRPTFGNDRDVEGSARLQVDDATYLRSGGSFPAPVDAPRAWLPWALVATGVLLIAVAAFLVPRVARRAKPARVPSPAPAASLAPPSSLAPSPPTPLAPSSETAVALTDTERRILEDILAHPGTAQRDIAERLGYTRQALHYHVKKLEARRLVVKRVEGRETRCEVPPAVASLVAPATRTGSHEKA